MFSKSDFLPLDLRRYLASITPEEPDLLRRLREETEAMPEASCQIPPEQGWLFSLLIRAMGARKALEIGVFTGYSSIVAASALPEDGRLIALDRSEEFTRVARRYWKEAGLEHKIDLRIAPALESLDRLVQQGEEGAFDFAFIDADKPNYDRYYEYCLRLVRPGGVIALDNVLQRSRVLDGDSKDAHVIAIRELNAKLKNDPRVIVSVLPFADGLTLALRK